jgi:predicted GNAT family N-acyltransferase
VKRRKTRKIKAWLVTWEWIGDHAKRDDKVAAIFNPRFSAERVRELVEFLYLTQNSTLSERMNWARDKNLNPYLAQFHTLDGVPWQGQIHCGHNPFLFARLVDDLAVECDAEGNERATWRERPKPDMLRKLRMRDQRGADVPENNDGENYEVKELSSRDLVAKDLAACIAIIKQGDAVDWESAAKELPRATALAIVYKGAQIVGIGAIKRERRTYAARVSNNSGVSFPPETLELGYVAIALDHRGQHLSHRIVSALLSRYSARLFATTYNARMKATLETAGFEKKGKEWKGKKHMLTFWEKA